MSTKPAADSASRFACAFAAALREDLRLRLDESDATRSPEAGPAIAAARSLAEWVSASAPPDAEVLLATSPPPVPVARLEACVVVARWQVRAGTTGRTDVAPIGAQAWDARRLIESEGARRVRAAFEAAGFRPTLIPVPGEDEVQLRAVRD